MLLFLCETVVKNFGEWGDKRAMQVIIKGQKSGVNKGIESSARPFPILQDSQSECLLLAKCAITPILLYDHLPQPLHNPDHTLGIQGTVGKQLLPYPGQLF